MTGPIVVGYDASQESQRAVDWALTAAQQRNLPLVVASVWLASFRWCRLIMVPPTAPLIKQMGILYLFMRLLASTIPHAPTPQFP